MSARKTKSGASAPSVARTPLGLKVYQPTKLDSVCKYTVGSFIAAGAAFAAMNVSASSASAEEIGGGFSDSSVGPVSFGDISLTSGGVSDFSTFAPTVSDFAVLATASEVTPDVLQAAEPVPDQSFEFVSAPDAMQITAPASDESVVVAASSEVAFAAPDTSVEIAGSTVEVSVSTTESAPVSDEMPATEFPELSPGLTDLQPTDGTIEQIDPIEVLGLPSGLVIDDPKFGAVVREAVVQEDVVQNLVGSNAGVGLSLDAGTIESVDPVDPINVFGLPGGRVTDDPEFAVVVNEATVDGGLNELFGVVPELRLGDESASPASIEVPTRG
jgi:hypothetical protein